MATERRVPTTTYLVVGLFVVATALPILMFAGGDRGPAPAFPEFGTGYEYHSETLLRFRKLLRSADWTLAVPPRNAQGMLEVVHEKTGLTFVVISVGSFEMGMPEDEQRHMWDDNSGPVHTVTVPTFLLCRTECTQRSWEKGGGKNESRFKGSDLPVEMVDWTECHDWCARNGVRLPSEAEWEYSCRAGTRTPFSTGEALTTDQANYNGNNPYREGREGKNREMTVPAGSLPPNPWGLHEMHGNVWEWCEDLWHEDYVGAPTDGSAWTTGDTTLRVYRGGGWEEHARNCRPSVRDGCSPSARGNNCGFRPAASLPD